MGGHHSPKASTVEWLTPPYVLDALGGAASFDLDPCSPADRPWPTAQRHYTQTDNGLIRRWHGRIWLNPPYSKNVISKWLARLSAHGIGIALIFARTETEAFHRHVWSQCSALLFLEGRLNFHYPDGAMCEKNAGAPSVLCAYGRNDADCLADCALPGQFVPLQIPQLFAILTTTSTWREILHSVMADRTGPVRLADLYCEIAAHPKSRGRQHFKAKVRQELQRGPYRRVGRGQWQLAI